MVAMHSYQHITEELQRALTAQVQGSVLKRAYCLKEGNEEAGRINELSKLRATAVSYAA